MVENRDFIGFFLGLSLCFVAPAVVAETSSPTIAQPVQQEKPKVLFLDLTCTGVKPEVVETISDLVGAYLGEHKKYDVITGQDLRQMAQLEVEKQKSGCMDNSCLSELAGAMGARYVVFGKVGKLAERTIITLNLFDSKEAKAVDRAVVSAPDIGSVPDLLPAAVAKLMGGKVVASPVMKPVVAGPPVTPAAAETLAPVAAPQAPPKTPAPVAAEKAAVTEPVPPVVEPESERAKRQVPWMRVGSASALAVIGAGVALTMGAPQYNVMTAAEWDYREATEGGGSDTATILKATAKTQQSSYMAGPVYALWTGSTLAVVTGSYALWAFLTAPVVKDVNVEVTP